MSRSSNTSKTEMTAFDGAPSPWEVYEVTGNSAGALKLLDAASETAAPEVKAYNKALLEAMVETEGIPKVQNLQSVMDTLKSLETSVMKAHSVAEPNKAPGSRKRRRDEWTITYNQSLLFMAQGKIRTSVAKLWEKVSPFVKSAPPQLSQDLLQILCRMALLALEGMLSLTVGSPSGIPQEWDFVDIYQSGSGAAAESTAGLLKLSELIPWLQQCIDHTKDNAQLKFSMSLYMARMGFLHRDGLGKLEDAKIRSARKELKQAMEIFQHKIRPSGGGDTGSLASSTNTPDPLQLSSTNPTTNNSETVSGNNTKDDQSLSEVARRLQQAALNLKANMEQLKGNAKKSLILCAEAQGSVPANLPTDNPASSYESTHFNNLAIVYETSKKPHLALHAWSKALARTTPAAIQSDGTVHFDQTSKILYNAAIGSLQSKNFRSAYECMGTCLQHSETWRSRGRCWVRLGEACLGLWSQGKVDSDVNGFMAIKLNGKSKGVLLDTNSNSMPKIGELSSTLASAHDVEQVVKYPLPRARASFATAVKIFESDAENGKSDKAGIISSQLSLAYIGLEQNEFQEALKCAEFVLKTEEPEGLDAAQKALFKRQQATASMYASEASCNLGDGIAAMKYLVGDGKNDAFDRLASDLGGVSIKTAAIHKGSEGKTRLAKAQAMVRCSASAASAKMGNLTAAKQLAMSAQAMSREGSYATRALVYCMLREGNQTAALTLLRSAR